MPITNIIFGVLMGPILAPSLLILFINDLPIIIGNCSYHLLSDDVRKNLRPSPGTFLSHTIYDINHCTFSKLDRIRKTRDQN